MSNDAKMSAEEVLALLDKAITAHDSAPHSHRYTDREDLVDARTAVSAMIKRNAELEAQTPSALRETGRDKRASNRQTSPEVLRSHGVSFTAHNNGAHLIVTHADKVADFWPVTGTYNVRGTKAYRRGVFRLLRDLGIDTEARDG